MMKRADGCDCPTPITPSRRRISSRDSSRKRVKDRTECFDDSFPCRREGCDKSHVWNWLNLFILNTHLDMDLHKVMPYLVKKGG
jgi:hypothetical protein